MSGRLHISGCVAFTFASSVARSAGLCRGHGAVMTIVSASLISHLSTLTAHIWRGDVICMYYISVVFTSVAVWLFTSASGVARSAGLCRGHGAVMTIIVSTSDAEPDAVVLTCRYGSCGWGWFRRDWWWGMAYGVGGEVWSTSLVVRYGSRRK